MSANPVEIFSRSKSGSIIILKNIFAVNIFKTLTCGSPLYFKKKER